VNPDAGVGEPATWKLRKLARFIAIYGPGRTFYKLAGRLRLRLPALPWRRRARDIGVIGCGQFAFATIGYFLNSAFGRRIAACFDPDERAASTFARAYDVPLRAASAESLLAAPGIRTIYIASNHASHADYAAAALRAGHDTYVEKPVAVTREQLVLLERARRGARGRIFAGYNRPFSAAVRALRAAMTVRPDQGISMQCFVSGHVLPPGHWYRRPEEGTRICGNVGHWLDLFVHVLAWRGQPARIDIALTWARDDEPDDNLAISLGTDRGDVCSIMLSSRTEPFEGINEAINLQHGATIAKIDDFRRLTLWQGPRLIQRRFWPKDVGHRLAILQPFRHDPARDWEEVLMSTLLMLTITDMVRARERTDTFDCGSARRALESAVAGA
jgi:predicted dehydrogenase